MALTLRKVHLDRIDVLRAIAILMVFFHHYWLLVKQQSPEFLTGSARQILLFPLEMGFLGVKLFFVLSGFCIHYSFINWQRRRNTARSVRAFVPQFFWRRFWRIYPPYFFALLLFYWHQYQNPFAPRSLRHLAIHASLLHNLLPGFIYNINPSFWSIGAEWQLYLIYPIFLALALAFRIEVAFALASLTAAAINYVGPHFTSSILLFNSPLAYWFDWCIGAFISDYFSKSAQVFRCHRTLLVFFFALLCAAYRFNAFSSLQFFIPTLFFATLVEWVIYFKRPVGFFGKPLILVGLSSYSLYLLHQPYLFWLHQRFPALWAGNSDFQVWMARPCLFLLPIFLVSFCYYEFVEKGSIEMGKRLWTRTSPKES